jgi:hypothetical protein
LTVLDRAATAQALNLGGYRLHPLKGDLQRKAHEVELAGTVEDTLDDIRRFIPMH